MMIYNKYIDEYINLVESGAVETNEDIKNMIELVKEKLNQSNVFIDNDKIDMAVDKIHEYFPYELLPWEKFVVGLIHCYYDDGTVVWDTFLIEMGRGAGKNGFISPVSWYLTTNFHGIKEYNVDIVANSEAQAKTSFEDVYNVIEDNKKLQKAFYYTKEKIIYRKTKSYLKYNTSNARTKDGLRPACVIFDEIHEYKDYSQIKVFKSALGKKKHSRIFMITTNGNVREGVLDDYLSTSKDILKGQNKTMRLLPMLYHLESKEEVNDKKLWEKANPSLRYFPNLQLQMQQEYEDMKFQPQLYAEFMTKRMNIPQENKDAEVTSWENILATNKEIPDLDGCICVAGIDYAKTTDFVCAGLLFLFKGIYYWVSHTWVCEKSADLDRIKAPLREWEKVGLLTFIDDVEISPDIPAEWIAEQAQKYNLTLMGMDNYRYTLLAKSLRNVGFDIDKKGANNIKLIRPSDQMKIGPIVNSIFAKHSVAWGNNPLMRWYTNNACMITSPAGNITYGKIEPKSRKTDGFMAMIAALCVADELEDSGDRINVDLGCYTY